MADFTWDNASEEAIIYCEKHGIYELYAQKGNVLTYYSYYGDDPTHPFIKVEVNIATGEEKRKRLRYTSAPKFLLTEEGYTKYNYYTG